VHFFPHQQQHLARILAVIIFGTIHPHVVVGENHGVDAGCEGGGGDLVVGDVPVGVAGVKVEVEEDFVHGGGSGIRIL